MIDLVSLLDAVKLKDRDNNGADFLGTYAWLELSTESLENLRVFAFDKLNIRISRPPHTPPHVTLLNTGKYISLPDLILIDKPIVASKDELELVLYRDFNAAVITHVNIAIDIHNTQLKELIRLYNNMANKKISELSKPHITLYNGYPIDRKSELKLKKMLNKKIPFDLTFNKIKVSDIPRIQDER